MNGESLPGWLRLMNRWNLDMPRELDSRELQITYAASGLTCKTLGSGVEMRLKVGSTESGMILPYRDACKLRDFLVAETKGRENG